MKRVPKLQLKVCHLMNISYGNKIRANLSFVLPVEFFISNHVDNKYMSRFSKLDPFDKRFLLVIFICLGIVITITTIIHHFFPFIVQVPPVMPPFTSPPQFWAFELLFWDMSAILLSALLFYHVVKKHGIWLATLFLTGSIIFTGLEECMWIFGGRFGLTFPTYFFTKGGLWFFEIPLYTCLGWFILAYSCVFIAENLFDDGKVFWSAFLGGVFAVMLDLWIDPINVNLGALSPYTSAGFWVWNMQDTLRIFGIPLMNFIGWFLVVFLFAYLWGQIREAQTKKHWSKLKCTIIFYACIPALLLICLVALGFIEIYVLQIWFRNVYIPF